METSIVILILSISVYIFAKAVETLSGISINIHFPDLFKKSGETGAEVVEEEPVKPRYDIEGFKRRMERLKKDVDVDGLYDVPIVPPRTDFTGAEIITEQYEADMDNFVRRNG